MKKISQRCPNCFRKTKVYLIDLNAYNGRPKIKFKRCKWKKMEKEEEHFCVALLLDKIVIRI